MNKAYLLIIVLGSLFANTVLAESTATDDLLRQYVREGVTQPDAAAGQRLWQKTFPAQGKYAQRSCGTCHGNDLKQAGKHIRTNKLIEPMAPSVNLARLSDVSKIEKWFKRNCHWTLGRDCTVSEKANLLAYIRQQ